MSLQVMLAIGSLAVLGLVGIGFAVCFARLAGRVLNFRSLVLLVYVIVENASGIVHLLDLEPYDRGYYDLLHPPSGGSPEILVPTLAAGVGLIALLAGLKGGVRPERTGYSGVTRALTARDRRYLLIAGVVLLPLTLKATIHVTHYVHSMPATRIIALTGGQSRIGYFAEWSVWSVAFLVLWLGATRLFSQLPGLRTALLGLSLAAVALLLKWTGGRSVLLTLSAPLLIALMPRERRYRLILTLALVIGGIGYIILLTHHRTQHYTVTSFTWADALDWQFGRFSMMGFAQTYVAQHGYLLGSSLLAGLLTVPDGILHFLGVAMPTPALITQISGQYLAGDPNAQYIVPGMTAELYMNFGFTGVAVGYYVLGRLIRRCDEAAERTRNLLRYFSIAYFGVLLVLASVPLQAGAIYDECTFVGLPVLVAYLVSRKSEAEDVLRSAAQAQVSPARGAQRRGDWEIEARSYTPPSS